MTLRSPKYDLREFSESVADLDVLEIMDAILLEAHALKVPHPTLRRRRRSPKKGTRKRQYFDDLQSLVPLFSGAQPTFRDGFAQEAWPMLRKLSEGLVSFSMPIPRPMAHSYSRAALTDLGRKHWKTYLPKKYRALKKAGTLEKELAAAADLTLKDMDEFKAEGLNVHEAWQASRELHLLLKEEPGPSEKMPDNPAYDAMMEANRGLAQED
jgi:hypothetical protein